MWIKSAPFNVWVKYFVCNFKVTLWNSTQNILPTHWKIWFLYNIEILRALRFKSSYAFLISIIWPRHIGNRELLGWRWWFWICIKPLCFRSVNHIWTEVIISYPYQIATISCNWRNYDNFQITQLPHVTWHFHDLNGWKVSFLIPIWRQHHKQ